MSDEKSSYDPFQFAKPDERKDIDAKRHEYLKRGGTIKVFPAVTMDRRGKRGDRPPAVEMAYFQRGYGARPSWYPGYQPRPQDRVSAEEQEAFRAKCAEKAKAKKRGKLPPTPVT